MAPSASPYDHSYVALKSLHRTFQKHNTDFSQIGLSERPRCPSTDKDRYLDSAVRILSVSTESIYNDSARWALTAFEVKESLDKVDKRFDKIDERLDKVDERFDKVDERFDKIEQRIDDVDERLSRQMGEVKDQVEEVKGQVDELKGQMEELKVWAEGRFRGLENRFTNMAAQHPWDDVVPVEYPIQPADLDRFLTIHPDKIVKLWRLQRPKHQMVLISLIEFYDIGGWESWGHEVQLLLSNDSDSDSSDIEEQNPDLVTAVRSHPRIALRALTNRLGVNYERMRETMLNWEKDQKHVLKKRAKKRKQGTPSSGLETQNTATSKVRKTDTQEAEERPTRLPIRDLVGNPSSAETKSSSKSGTKLGWGSPEGPQRVFRDAKSASSGDATVPFSEDINHLHYKGHVRLK